MRLQTGLQISNIHCGNADAFEAIGLFISHIEDS